MKKIVKRLLALLIVFASMFSFLPLQFGDNGQEANAANDSSVDISYADLSLRVVGGTSILDKKTDDTVGKLPYYNTSDGENTFDLTISDFSKTENQIKEELLKKYPEGGSGETTYVSNAYMNIISLNNIKLATRSGAEIPEGRDALDDLEIKMEKITPSGALNRFGVRFDNMPLGVDRIDYNLLGTVQKIKYTVNKETSTVTLEKSGTYDNVNLSESIDSFIINNGKDFVGKNVESFTLDQYVGKRDLIDSEETKYNNKAPLLYTAEAEADETIKMRYTWEVPDSLTALNYKMKFTMDLFNTHDNTNVYVNGTKGQGQAIDSNTISGFLNDLSNNDQFVVIKTKNGTDIAKSYSAEIRFPKKKTENDFSLIEAGVLKAEYANDSSVKAYIGKKFTETAKTDADGNRYVEYKGTITIDHKARMVCLRPKVVSGVNVEYELYNNYTVNGITKAAKAYELINGQAYIDFNLGDENELELQIKDASTQKLLAKYIYTVKQRDDAEKAFNENFIFDDNNSNTYLTREGSKEKISFKVGKSENRSTFDLYTKDKNEVKITLDPDGITNSNEYFKVWTSDTLDGNNFTEAQASIDNEFDINSGIRDTDLYVDISKAKRIMVQAYYDEVTEKDGVYTLVKSYSLGSKYIFFIPANINSSDTDDNQKSDNAVLSNIKVKGQTLYNLDEDKNGFSIDSRNYRVTVPKDQTTAVLTVVPEDENVKSIVATVSGTDTSYELYPGEETEFMLNSSGITDLEITVTAQNGKKTEVYNLSIINNSKGGSSKLKDLILSSGDFKFDSDVYTTKVQVEQSVNKISITPIAEDSKAKITINGQKFTGKPISVSLAGKQTTEVDIEVESEDGESTTTYTLKIKRVSVISDDDSDNNQGTTEDIYYDYDNDCWVDTTKYDEWGTIKNRVMYFDKRGRQVKDRWIYTGKKWYYLNEAGYRATGWKIDDETGQRYYMDNVTGEMKMGWMNLNGSWYYLGTTGLMHTGWLWLNNNWYYFTENGEMITNQSMVIDGKMYRFATDGRIY